MCCEIFNVMIKAVLAGVAIGCGGMLFTLIKWGTLKLNNHFTTDDWTQPGQIVGGCVFSVGLMLVCWFKLMLFTGKVGLMFESNQDGFYFIGLLIMIVFNIGGAVCVGLLSEWIFGRFDDYKEAVLAIANLKSKFEDSNDYLKCCMNSLFCGVCVHLAVRGFVNCDNNFEKFMIIFWFVLMFVYSGFEHCIANSFYFACAHMTKREVFINVALAIGGNWLGTLPTSVLTVRLPDRTSNDSVPTAQLSGDENSSSSTDDYVEPYDKSNRRSRAVL